MNRGTHVGTGSYLDAPETTIPSPWRLSVVSGGGVFWELAGGRRHAPAMGFARVLRIYLARSPERAVGAGGLFAAEVIAPKLVGTLT